MDTPFHWILSVHIFVLILDAQLLHVLIPLLYRLTGLHVLIVYVFLLHRSWFILLRHGYSCIPATDIDIHVTDINIPVTGYVSC